MAKTLSTFTARLRGRKRTDLECYTYFEERNFQPILREAPILAQVELALYEGMVLQAEEVAQNWTNLLHEEREQYRQMAFDTDDINRYTPAKKFQEITSESCFSSIVR